MVQEYVLERSGRFNIVVVTILKQGGVMKLLPWGILVFIGITGYFSTTVWAGAELPIGVAELPPFKFTRDNFFR